MPQAWGRHRQGTKSKTTGCQGTRWFAEFYPGIVMDAGASDQWNCSSSVEPVSAFTLEEPP